MRFRRMSKSASKRRGVSPIIATLMLIAITVAAAVILYGFVNGLFGGFAKGGPSYLVTANGQMVVPGSTDVTGILSLTLKNEGSQAITGVAVTCSSPPFITVGCAPALPAPQLTFLYSGVAINPANPLPVNGLGAGSVAVSAAAAPGFAAGTSYQVMMTITFLGGSTQIVLISVPSTS
jgi:flagellin-like protein